MSRSHQVPGPCSGLGIGNALEFRRQPIAFLEDLAERYGDIVHFRLGWKHAFLLNHPDFVEQFLVSNARKLERGPVMQRGRMVMGEGLLTSEDPLHASQRRLIQPAFHRERLTNYADVTVQYVQRTCSRWHPGGQVLDLRNEMMGLTLAILGKTLFDAQIEGEAAGIGEAVNELMSLVDLVFVPFSRFLLHLPVSAMRRLNRVHLRLDHLIRGLIEQRMRSPEDRGDLLSTLLGRPLPSRDRERALRQVRDECVTMLLAGHETIANALTYALYLVAQNPVNAQRVRAEVNQIAGERDLRAEDFDRLTFTHHVMAESMRLYPPVWILGRTASRPCSVGPYMAPRGSILFASQYLLHRDNRFFPEPLKFNPDRFEKGCNVHRFRYFPFGVGPRRCIGEGFAWMEAVLALGTILRHMEIELLPQTTLVLDPKITLRLKQPVLVKVTRVIKSDRTSRALGIKECPGQNCQQSATTKPVAGQ